MNELMSILVDIGIIVGVIFLAYLFKYVKEKINNENNTAFRNCASVFVKAAEQLYDTGVLQSDGRKEYVLNMLKEIGFSTYDDTDAVIESAVYDLNNDKTTILEPITCDLEETK